MFGQRTRISLFGRLLMPAPSTKRLCILWRAFCPSRTLLPGLSPLRPLLRTADTGSIGIGQFARHFAFYSFTRPRAAGGNRANGARLRRRSEIACSATGNFLRCRLRHTWTGNGHRAFGVERMAKLSNGISCRMGGRSVVRARH